MLKSRPGQNSSTSLFNNTHKINPADFRPDENLMGIGARNPHWNNDDPNSYQL